MKEAKRLAYVTALAAKRPNSRRRAARLPEPPAGHDGAAGNVDKLADRGPAVLDDKARDARDAPAERAVELAHIRVWLK